MAIFGRREVPLKLVFDSNRFQELADQVRQLTEGLNAAADRAEEAAREIRKLNLALDKNLKEIQREKRRPIIRNSS
jgi:chromosome segregation ATPase